MRTINGLYYSREHEWIRVEGDKAYLGITDYAQDALGDVVYVDLPEVDREYEADEAIGAVESVKAASDVYAPVRLRVLAVNTALEEHPELLNEDPYEHYIAIIEIVDPNELNRLMDAEAYEAFCQTNG
ncbi:MAG TPA: glycine cleavage system protein GcvH [Haloplasmataceae bacterium]